MKTKNQTGQSLLELAVHQAANEDAVTPASPRDAREPAKPSWSPLEVWRTRVKNNAPLNGGKSA